MDRRTVLAFLLMAALLILYQVLFPEPARRVEPAPRSASQDAAEQPVPGGGTSVPSLDAPTPPVAAAPPAAEALGRRTSFGNTLVGEAGTEAPPAAAPITIDQPEFRATIHPRGARISTWTMKRFTDAQEHPADLVPVPAEGLLKPGLLVGGTEISLDETTFRVEASPRASAGAPRGAGGTAADTVRLHARDDSGAEILLEYTFPGETPYSAGLYVRVDGVGRGEGEEALILTFPEGVAHLERDPKMDRNAAAGIAQVGSRVVKHRPGRKRDGWREVDSGVIRWAGSRSKYFLAALVPREAPDGTVVVTPGRSRVVTPAGPADGIATSLRLPLHLDGPSEYRFQLYAGPMQYHVLEEFGAGLEKAMDLGWKVIVPFSRLLLSFFQAVHRVVPNYGLVIIILSVLVKLLFYPLTRKSMESMRQMQLLKPEMDRLGEKYKNDPQRRQQATMELYKKYKVNPLGGCLPILVQMPVFIALYNVLNTSIELRKAPFALWIQDLSAPDKVGEVLGFPINILPLLMAATTVWQQKLTPTDPRQAAMAYLMPVIMTVFFYTMPSGLVLYWTVTNLMAVGQQLWMNRATKQQLVAA